MTRPRSIGVQPETLLTLWTENIADTLVGLSKDIVDTPCGRCRDALEGDGSVEGATPVHSRVGAHVEGNGGTPERRRTVPSVRAIPAATAEPDESVRASELGTQEVAVLASLDFHGTESS